MSIFPGIRHCLSWREAITSGRLPLRDGYPAAVVANSAPALNDSAALLWRVYITVAPHRRSRQRKCATHPGGVETRSGLRDAHAALAFAVAGDEVSMGQMIDRLRGLADAGMSWLARSHRLWHRVLTPLHMGPIARRSDTWSRLSPSHASTSSPA